jgi:hypothetical protein
MRRTGDKLGHKLSTRFVQVLVLPTESTVRAIGGFIIDLLYGLEGTANAQLTGRYAQAVQARYDLLAINLCPVSTAPTTNTNHIKE